MTVYNEKMRKRLERTSKTGDYSVCPLCGRDFKSDSCPHAYTEIQDALGVFRGMKALGLA